MEKWKDIPGYEGLYQASNLGRIRTCEGKTTSSARFARRVWKQRILKPKCQPRKNAKHIDERVELWKDGQHHTHLVSRLVAITWCRGYEEGLTVNHIDGNPMNNNIENLEWVTLGENVRKAFEASLYSTQKAVLLTDKDGSTHKFRSMAEASRFLGRSNNYISALLAKGKKQTPDGYQFSPLSRPA